MEENPFWQEIERLLTTHPLVIDRPRGLPHPRYPDMIYPLDYGYIEGTHAADGDGIDIWMGSDPFRKLDGILCTYDTVKKDAEIKLVIGCTPAEVDTIKQFHAESKHSMYYLFIPKPQEQ